jgi:fatty acid desaturase
LPLSAKFPVSKASLRRKLLRDMTGLTFLRLRVAAIKGVDIDGNDAFKQKGPSLTLPINFMMFLVLALLGHWWVYFALWLAPLMTWFMVVLRIRNIAEHAMTEDNSNALRHARTTHANILARIFIAPYWVNYHVEHHAYMYVPCYRFPALHESLTEAGHRKEMIYAPSYSNVLKTVSTG